MSFCREFYFLSLFPEILSTVLDSSILKRAQQKGLAAFHPIQIRDFSEDKHRTVDGSPFGGGEGMLLRADVLHRAWASVASPPASSELEASSRKEITVLLTPQGQPFSQDLAKEFSTYSKIVFVCGHYEGVDERFIDLCVDREISIGDYVLTGGELPALVVADAVTRLIPGVVGNEQSVSNDSLENGLLKYPQYTRPREFMGRSIPEILLSGDHSAIREWREQQMRERTRLKRPDLFAKLCDADK